MAVWQLSSGEREPDLLLPNVAGPCSDDERARCVVHFEQVVHSAVRELIAAGDDRPAMTAVATRAGVNAATIYRRWGSIDGLLLDVAVKDTNDRVPVPASGDLRADLLAYAQQVSENVSKPGGLGFLRAVVAVASDRDRGPETAMHLLESRLDQFQNLLDSARPTTRLAVIDLIDGVLAPIYLRALLSQPSTIIDSDLVRLVDNLIAIDQHRNRTEGE